MSEKENKMETGLVNIGNTCYLNAVLQCICRVPEMYKYFTVTYQQQTQYFPKRTNIMKAFAKQFYNLITSLHDRQDTRPIQPQTFRRLLGIFNTDFLSSRQQDAHECLLLIMNKLHESIKIQVIINIEGTVTSKYQYHKKKAYEQYKKFLEITGYSEINKLFYGQYKSSIKCEKCENITYKYDPYCTIEIQIPENAVTLYDCLDKFCCNEKLEKNESYNCDNCKTKNTTATKKLKLWNVPQILIVQLKRFKHDYTKLNKHIHCPHLLNLTKYTSQPDKPTTPNNINIQMMTLISTIEHSGNLNAGHYIAKCKTTSGWKLFNDAHVTPIPTNNVITKNTYILMYKTNPCS